jgi:hypothetical protein
MKHFRLAQGMNAAVDLQDLDRVLAAGDWSFDNGRVVLSRSMDTTPVYLDVFVMGKDCEYIDGDPLTNCRHNLRVIKVAKKARRRGKKA